MRSWPSVCPPPSTIPSAAVQYLNTHTSEVGVHPGKHGHWMNRAPTARKYFEFVIRPTLGLCSRGRAVLEPSGLQIDFRDRLMYLSFARHQIEEAQAGWAESRLLNPVNIGTSGQAGRLRRQQGRSTGLGARLRIRLGEAVLPRHQAGGERFWSGQRYKPLILPQVLSSLVMTFESRLSPRTKMMWEIAGIFCDSGASQVACVP